MLVAEEEVEAWIAEGAGGTEEVACIRLITPVELVSTIRGMEHESTVNRFKYVTCAVLL